MMNDTAHNERHALAIDLSDLSSGDYSRYADPVAFTLPGQ
jgi:hypothetical protein